MAEESKKLELLTLDQVFGTETRSKIDKQIISDLSKDPVDEYKVLMHDMQNDSSASNPISDLQESSNFLNRTSDIDMKNKIAESFSYLSDSYPQEETYTEMFSNGLKSAGNVMADAWVGAVAGVGSGFLSAADALEGGVESIAGGLGFDLDLPVDQWNEAMQKRVKELEDSAENPNLMGMTRTAFQFLTGFVPIFRALKGVKALTGVGTLQKTMIADALSGAFFFDPDDPNANAMGLLAQTEVLKDIDAASGGVIETFFVNDPDDPDAVKRLRNGLSGFVEGRVMDGFVSGLVFVSKYGIAGAKKMFGATDDFIGPKLPEDEQITRDLLQENITKGKAELVELDRLAKEEGLTSEIRGKRQNAMLVTRNRVRSFEVEQKKIEGTVTEDDIRSVLQAEDVALDAESRQQLDVLMSMELPKELRGATPHYPKGQGKIDFPDDVTKSLYIVRSDKKKGASARGAEYREFLRKKVGLDDSEIDELAEMVVKDVNAMGRIEPFALYRENLRTAIDLGHVKADVKINDIVAQKGIRVVSSPVSQSGESMLDFDIPSGNIAEMKGFPQEYKLKESPDVPMKDIGYGKEVPFVTRGKRDYEYRVKLGTIKTPQDFQNLFDWWKLEFMQEFEKGAGKRMIRDDEMAMAM
jgi:hypothetical protein